MWRKKSNFSKFSKGQWENLKRAEARFSIFPLAFENFEKFDFFWSINPDYEYRQIGNIARLGISPDWEVRQIEDSPTNGQIGAWARLDPNCQIAVRQIGARLGKRPDCQIASARLPPDCLRLSSHGHHMTYSVVIKLRANLNNVHLFVNTLFRRCS